MVGPRSDGHLVISAAGKLWLVGGNKRRRHFIPSDKRQPRYALFDPGVEPYIAHVPADQCGFRKDELYALSGPAPAVLRVGSRGAVFPFVNLPSNFASKGIVLDTVGLFGGQLLVIGKIPGATQLYGICNGQLSLIAQVDQRIEGGLAIAPLGFGVYAGQLLGPDEASGNIYALDAGGAVHTIATPPAVAGGDLGVESLGVVPAGMTSKGAAFLADRTTPGNIQPGSGLLTRIGWPQLQNAGVLAGDLLVATEGGANTFAVRCDLTTCSSQLVAYGLTNAHSEGHIAFAPTALAPIKPRPAKKPAPKKPHRRKPANGA